MKIEYCFRLQSYGEPIHGTYDSELKTMSYLPTSFYNINDITFRDYSSSSYINNPNKDFYSEVESILEANENNAIVIEECSVGYNIIQFNGLNLFCNEHENIGSRILQLEPTKAENFMTIGYRLTRPSQYRHACGIYKLCYDLERDVACTCDGDLKTEFSAYMLEPLSESFDGYKELVKTKHYAIVYTKDGYKFVDKVDNRLVIV